MTGRKKLGYFISLMKYFGFIEPNVLSWSKFPQIYGILVSIPSEIETSQNVVYSFFIDQRFYQIKDHSDMYIKLHVPYDSPILVQIWGFFYPNRGSREFYLTMVDADIAVHFGVNFCVDMTFKLNSCHCTCGALFVVQFTRWMVVSHRIYRIFWMI